MIFPRRAESGYRKSLPLGRFRGPESGDKAGVRAGLFRRSLQGLPPSFGHRKHAVVIWFNATLGNFPLPNDTSPLSTYRGDLSGFPEGAGTFQEKDDHLLSGVYSCRVSSRGRSRSKSVLLAFFFFSSFFHGGKVSSVIIRGIFFFKELIQKCWRFN